MNERILHGLWRLLSVVCGLSVAFVGVYVSLQAINLVPPVRIGTVETYGIEPPSQAITDPEYPLYSQTTIRGNLTQGQAAIENGQSSPVVFWVNLGQLPTGKGLAWISGGIAGILLGSLLILLGLASVEGLGRTVVLRGMDQQSVKGSGRVTVSMRSLHALVTGVAEQIDGIREVHTRLRLKRSGWYVACSVAHAPGSSYPNIVRDLNLRITEALEHHSGLPVARIDVTGRLGLIKAERRLH